MNLPSGIKDIAAILPSSYIEYHEDTKEQLCCLNLKMIGHRDLTRSLVDMPGLLQLKLSLKNCAAWRLSQIVGAPRSRATESS